MLQKWLLTKDFSLVTLRFCRLEGSSGVLVIHSVLKLVGLRWQLLLLVLGLAVGWWGRVWGWGTPGGTGVWAIDRGALSWLVCQWEGCRGPNQSKYCAKSLNRGR